MLIFARVANILIDKDDLWEFVDWRASRSLKLCLNRVNILNKDTTPIGVFGKALSFDSFFYCLTKGFQTCGRYLCKVSYSDCVPLGGQV